MKALVVGGNGFIGSHLVDKLTAIGWDVVVLDLLDRRYDALPRNVNFIRGDLTQTYFVREALDSVNIVYHLAWATIHELANQDPAADVYTNLIPTIHLLESCREANVDRFIFISSGGTVYGPSNEIPILESHPTNPVTAYGVSKLAVEKYMQMFYHLYGLDYAILRPSTPFGPRQNPKRRQGAVSVFLYRVANGLPLQVWGDGSVTRDYFYVTDLIDALVDVAVHPLGNNKIFNIGGIEEISLNQLINLVEITVGEKAIVNYQPCRKFDALRIVLDTSLAKQQLNWQPKVSLTEGLSKMWAWISSVDR
jgi:UDP-glucose 4-epimerase